MRSGPGCGCRDLLDRAGVKPGAVRCGLTASMSRLSRMRRDFMKSLAIDHARDGEVMVAYAMNGEQLPLVNGFPLRLVVPGWYATYWVKMLNDVEVLISPTRITGRKWPTPFPIRHMPASRRAKPT